MKAFKDAIKQYLDKRAKEDALFAEAYKREGKTIDECVNYILCEVQKIAKKGMTAMTDDEVFGMAVHYYDEADVKDKEKFFGIVITDGELFIQVLKSVTEFFEEGKSMHHCVFANEYYKKKDSLILSAKVAGERKETIEVNLKTFSIVQSRSAFNKSSEYHARIIELMNKNMNLIRQCV